MLKENVFIGVALEESAAFCAPGPIDTMMIMKDPPDQNRIYDDSIDFLWCLCNIREIFQYNICLFALGM